MVGEHRLWRKTDSDENSGFIITKLVTWKKSLFPESLLLFFFLIWESQYLPYTGTVSTRYYMLISCYIQIDGDKLIGEERK